eukprot:TRINITY_DN34742_c0_g1_i1.p2 TRINITY_DN34742_c0_g1~~TRINITY_DN34742_c0_g1_i1.p2  ORF type:complete len:108 (+),score=5.25 TRINITY_DN34742_c0_g1_i1:245-568(+)
MNMLSTSVHQAWCAPALRGLPHPGANRTSPPDQPLQAHRGPVPAQLMASATQTATMKQGRHQTACYHLAAAAPYLLPSNSTLREFLPRGSEAATQAVKYKGHDGTLR